MGLPPFLLLSASCKKKQTQDILFDQQRGRAVRKHTSFLLVCFTTDRSPCTPSLHAWCSRITFGKKTRIQGSRHLLGLRAQARYLSLPNLIFLTLKRTNQMWWHRKGLFKNCGGPQIPEMLFGNSNSEHLQCLVRSTERSNVRWEIDGNVIWRTLEEQLFGGGLALIFSFLKSFFKF